MIRLLTPEGDPIGVQYEFDAGEDLVEQPLSGGLLGGAVEQIGNGASRALSAVAELIRIADCIARITENPPQAAVLHWAPLWRLGADRACPLAWGANSRVG